jgi:hypothetical protein
MRSFLIALAALLFAVPAFAQSTAAPVVTGYLSTVGCPYGQTTCFVQFGAGGGGNAGQSAVLLTNASSTGPAVVIPQGGGYFFNLTGTFGGATVALTQTVNGVTSTVASYTAATPTGTSTPCFYIGSGTTVRATVTGGSPSGLNATLNGGGCPTSIGGAVLVQAAGSMSNNNSGTITTGGTFQTLLAANSARKGCTIQNPTTATEPLYVSVAIATGSATTAKSFSLVPGATFQCTQMAGPVITDNIAIEAATTGHVFVEIDQ